MWPWSKDSDKPATPKPSPPETNAQSGVKKVIADFDPNKLPEREKLPAKLQKIVDDDDKDDFLDDLREG